MAWPVVYRFTMTAIVSSYSLDEYLAIKHVMSDITGVAEKGWHRTIFKLR